MDKFQNIQEVREYLEDGMPLETVEELVDKLVSLGYEDKVHAFHDDFIDMKDEIPDSLLNQELDSLEEYSYNEDEDVEESKARILSEANTIIPLFEREVTEEIQEEIDENNRLMGIRNDD